MERKIIELGNNCMVMSLPIKWVKENKLKKGLALSVEEVDNKLVVKPKLKDKTPTEIEINIVDSRESYRRTIIVNAYRAGFDRIIVHYSGSQKHLIEIVNNRLLGFEIFNQSKNTYLLESISEPEEDTFDKIMGKNMQIVGQIIRNIGSDELHFDVTRVSKHDNFLKRCISKKTISMSSHSFMWQFISNITQIAHQCGHLNRHINGKSSFSKKEEDTLKMIEGMFAILHKGYIKNDKEILMNLHQMEQKIVYDERDALFKTKDATVPHYLISIARLIYLANSPLMGAIHMTAMQH